MGSGASDKLIKLQEAVHTHRFVYLFLNSYHGVF